DGVLGDGVLDPVHAEQPARRAATRLPPHGSSQGARRGVRRRQARTEELAAAAHHRGWRLVLPLLRGRNDHGDGVQLPGMGKLLFDSVMGNDFVVSMAILMILSTMVL